MVNIFPDPSKLNDHENTNKIVLVIFIKIAKPKVKEELKISLLNKKLKIINWFDCHYTNIGKEDYWSDVLIVEFKDKFELEKYYKNGVGKIDLEAVQVFNLLPKNLPRLFVNFLKLFRPIGYFFELIKSSNKELQNLSNEDSNILPTKKQAERLLNEKSTKSLHD